MTEVAEPVKKRVLPKFLPGNANGFLETVKENTEAYFEKNNLSKHGNFSMYFKTFCMISLYIVPLGFVISGIITNIPLFIGLWIIAGFGLAGIGLSVMHDANHGAYSSNKIVNRILGLLLNFIGGFDSSWRIQHNILHHSFTNIDGHDEDIDPSPVLRFSPHKPLRKIHRFQYIYAWFFYCLMTFSWVFWKDFRQIGRYERKGLLKAEKTNPRREWIILLCSRLVYFSYILVLPFLFSGMPWYVIMAGFVLMHFTGGLVLAAVFQPAHVVQDCEFPLPEEGKTYENTWAVHQMLNTMDFAPNNRLLSWYVGGLNFQVEHHLFPGICHVHYRALSKIVRDAAIQYNVPYLVAPTFRSALSKHTQMLKRLGRE